MPDLPAPGRRVTADQLRCIAILMEAHQVSEAEMERYIARNFGFIGLGELSVEQAYCVIDWLGERAASGACA